MRRFYAPTKNFTGDIVTLDTEETRHLRDVLRLTVDDEVSIFDGMGNEFNCVVRKIEKKSSELNVKGKILPASPESPLQIRVGATVLNGEKYDLIIQKTVELGVTELVPLHTVRCDVRVKDAKKRLDRWRRIALEATKQSGRASIMSIAEPVDLKELIADVKGQNVVMFSEREGDSFQTLKESKKITAIFGPKGGWDDSELEMARENGINVVTLGGRILRAETAAIAITAILQHRFGDLR